MLSALELLPVGLLRQVASCLVVQDCIRLAQVSRRLLRFLQNEWILTDLCFDYALRQRIRRQAFNDELSTSLPSHFTHIFTIDPDHADIHRHKHFLRTLLARKRDLKCFRHLRSPKTLKLHHPYFYRQLPLALKNGGSLPAAALCPDDIPLPHDLSMVDLTHLLIVNHMTLESVDIATFDSSPLPWNSTPSRVCPRDILQRCIYEHQNPSRSQPLNPQVVCVWCPDCKPAQHEHSVCWRVAGEAIRNQLASLLAEPGIGSSDAQATDAGPGCSLVSEGCLSFPKLKSLSFRGWAVTNFMSILRVLNCHSFPALEELSLGGTVIMAPSLTDSKDAVPRPRLYLAKRDAASHEQRVHWPGKEADLAQRFMQLLSFHYSPFARRYNEKAEEEYWMGLFNGVLWTRSSFPSLRRLSLRVGNFDDACRWITPMMENCFSYCQHLETLELDHSIVQSTRIDDPILRLFSLVRDRAQESGEATLEAFPSLRFVKLRIMNGPFEVARLQEILSDVLGRLIIVKVRKLFLRLASRLAEDEAELIRNWTTIQRERVALYVKANPRAQDKQRLLTLSDEELSIFGCTTDGSPMLIITFDSSHPVDDPEADAHLRDSLSSTHPLFYGNEVSKLFLKHITPTSPTHQRLLARVRLGQPSDAKKTVDDERDMLPLLSTSDAYDESTSPRSLKRVTIQLDLPQVWQVTEEEAKAAVTAEVITLRELLAAHPDLSHAAEARVTSCTRLTYGGSNWSWWEELICGQIRRPEKNLQVDGWARESKDVIDGERLKIYKCSHVWSVDYAAP